MDPFLDDSFANSITVYRVLQWLPTANFVPLCGVFAQVNNRYNIHMIQEDCYL